MIGARGDLLVPSHVLHFDGTTSLRNPNQKIPMAERGLVAPLADEHCGWKHYKDSVADPGALWQCYDTGFRLAGDAIAATLQP